ncbi:MAG: hypothetical protein MJ179_02505 [Treponema sp.]|nr:hypothetical protein [Treponema sp.]
MNEQNLRTPTSEEAREMQKKGAEARKRNNEKRKLMSAIYAEFLEKEYNVKTGEGTKKINGSELVNEAMKKIIARGDSSTVSLLREIREGIEGSKVQLSGEVRTGENITEEERKEIFKKLMEK